MRGSRPLLTVALAILLVLAGCAGGGDSANLGATQASFDGDAGGASGEEAAEVTGTAVDDASASAGERDRIKTAEFRIRVDEFEESRSNLSDVVERQGGYVSSSRLNTQERGNETYTDGRIVYRVPAENYSEFIEAVRSEGTVDSENENVEDVTRAVADLEARLESLRAERDRLRELYDDANTTEDVLAVQRELADVQREIETTEAQLRTLENQVAYSTVTVDFREERPDWEPDRDHWYDTGVIAAFLESIDGALVAVRALVVGTAYALPYIVVFGVPAYGLFVVASRFRGGGFNIPFVGTDGSGAGTDVPADDTDESSPSEGESASDEEES